MARPPKAPNDIAIDARAKGDTGRSAGAEASWQGDMDNIEDLANALAVLEARVTALENA